MSQFLRIFEPRLERAIKGIELLRNGAKYGPAQSDVDDMFIDLDCALDILRAQYGCQKEEVVSDAKPTPYVVSAREIASATSRFVEDGKRPSQVKAPKARIENGEHYLNVARVVQEIPAGLLSTYITHLVNRVLEDYDTSRVEHSQREAQR
jgi:hypothetical protein